MGSLGGERRVQTVPGEPRVDQGPGVDWGQGSGWEHKRGASFLLGKRRVLTSLIFSRWVRTRLWDSSISWAPVPRTGWRRRLRNALKSKLNETLPSWGLRAVPPPLRAAVASSRGPVGWVRRSHPFLRRVLAWLLG